MPNILIVDDERQICELLKQNLEFAGYECAVAYDGDEALAKLSRSSFDLCLLDVMMPFTDGFTALTEMRRRGYTLPVIMLTARGEENDRVYGLEQGADDYITKPFSPRELVARIKAVLGRTLVKKQDTERTFRFGDMSIDEKSHEVKIGDEVLSLTPKEFDLLLYFAENEGVALSREKILSAVWNYDYLGEDRTVDTHIKMLRGHLKEYRDCIKTVWGLGYKFSFNR